MVRRCVVVHGRVQGVGFRPFVYGLAMRHQLFGFVQNQCGAVHIEIEGDAGQVDDFCADLSRRAPPLAAILDISVSPLEPLGEREFRIEGSSFQSAGPIFISPDVAACDECLAEMSDPGDRRHRYPFLNCTNCGPRLTIIRGAPYDRARTTMAGFPMCPDCHAEFDDPWNRRFHAQPTACARCGPRLQLADNQGGAIEADNPVSTFVKRLSGGKIGALKGLGGYHLICDAGNEDAVRELRRRKQRDEKPFAVMVFDAAAARRFTECDAAEEELLRSPARPIVLLRKLSENGRHGNLPDTARQIAPSVAPGNPCLGIFLPYTPLHWLVLSEAGGMPLVMTSGNRSDEPIAYEDGDAFARLGNIADVFLTHNRPIHVRCDDSVMRVVQGRPTFLRRSRGYAPQPVKMPVVCDRHLLAVGGQFKGTFALGRDDLAILSHHLGDLDHFEAYRAFERDERLYEELFDVRPRLIVHDLHPDYASTRYARQRSAKEGIGTLAVQHHHAHIASCMAEHGLNEEVIGVAFDGTGYGTDGSIWGGEFLLADLCGFRRAAHLRTVRLPGGDQAIREPWRSAAAHLIDSGFDLEMLSGFASAAARRTVEQMIARNVNSVPTSSMGRLFDAIAALAGVRGRVTYEGQAAMELEWLATGLQPVAAYPFAIQSSAAEASSLDVVSKPGAQARVAGFRRGGRSDGPVAGFRAFPSVRPGHPIHVLKPVLVIDTRPLVRAVVDDVRSGSEARHVARRFHSTVVELIAAVCARLRQRTGVATVVCSGGVFMNALVREEAMSRLRADGFTVYSHRQVPANDGGLCLGQLAVGAATLRQTGPEKGRRASSAVF